MYQEIDVIKNFGKAKRSLWIRSLVPSVALASMFAMGWAGSARAQSDAPAPRVSTIDWVSERCDYLIAKTDEGYAVVFIMSPAKLSVGDTLEGDIHSVGYIRRIIKQGSGDVIMMRGEKYGIKRKVAVKTIREYSRYCKPEDTEAQQ